MSFIGNRNWDGNGPVLIMSPCAFERRWIAEKELGIVIERTLDFESQPINALVSEVGTPSLFGGNGWIAIDGAKGKLDPFASFGNVVILAASGSGKGFFTIDYSKEKPWDRKGRLVKWTLDTVSKFGKKIEPQAAAHLVELTLGEMSLLYQEIEKLVTFVGTGDIIDHTAVKAVCIAGGELNHWKISEAIVFEGKSSDLPQFHDAAALHQFLGQLRYHLTIGRKMASMQALDNAAFPTLRPKQLSDFFGRAQKRGLAHFQGGMNALFDLELKLKTTSVSPNALFIHFYAKMHA